MKSRLWFAIALLLGTCQAYGQGSFKTWKDDKEKELVAHIVAEQDPAKRVMLLDEWTAKYGQTEFEEERYIFYLVNFRMLNRTEQWTNVAKRMLDRHPGAASVWISLLAPSFNNPSAQILDLTATSASALLLSTTLSAKPAEQTEEAWQAVTKTAASVAYNALAWVSIQRQNFEAAEKLLRRSLEANPNQGIISLAVGTLILQQAAPARLSEAIYHFARAAQYDGVGSLDEASRKALRDNVKQAYDTIGGSDAGWTEMISLVKSNALPPQAFRIRTVQQELMETAFASSRQALGGKDETKYEEFFVKGTRFLVGTNGGLRVAVSISEGRYLQARVYVANEGTESVTIVQPAITLSTKDSRKGQTFSLKALDPDDYLRSLSKRGRWRMMLAGALVGMGDSLSSTSNVSGQFYGSGSKTGNFSGFFYGSMTDQAAAHARTRARIDAMNAEFQERIKQKAKNLFRTETILPGSQYVGDVYFQMRRAKEYQLTVPVGGLTFQFKFNF